jgi:hypothetical protein
MADANVRSWPGGAYWNFKAKSHPLFGDAWLTRYATWPYVKLRLDDEGGALLHGNRSEPAIRFGWQEVEDMERVRVLGVPFLGEGVCFTLKEAMVWGIRRRFVFFSGSKGRTLEMLELSESKGVRVERRAKNKFTVP